MKARVLTVLMWKHALVRKRKFIQTAVECLCPLLFFLLLFFLGKTLANSIAEELAKEKQKPQSNISRLTETRSPLYKIMYHPESQLINSLMDDVGAKLNLQRLVSNGELIPNFLYEEIPIPKTDGPSKKQLPSTPAHERYASINKTTKETRRDRNNARLVTLAQEKEKAKRLADERAQLAREVTKEAIKVKNQRHKEKKMASIAAEFLSDPLLEVVEEEQFEWDHADERLVAQGVQLAKGEGATAVTAEDTKQAPGEDILRLNEIKSPPFKIMYHPESLLPKSFMDDVGAKLKLQKPVSNSFRSEKGFFPLSRVSRLNDFATDMHIMEAIVIFHGMTRKSWPERLNYTIRMNNAFHTETYKAPDDSLGTHKDYGLEYGTFTSIQWAIDTSYIKRLTGKEVPVKLSLEDFPDSKKAKIMGMFFVFAMANVICSVSLMLPYVFLMVRLLKERTSGIQELMKSVGVSLNTLCIAHFLNALPCGLVFAIGNTIILKITSNPMIPKTNAVLMCLMLFLYFNTIVSLAFVCSYISRRTQYAVTLSVMTYTAFWVLGYVIFMSYRNKVSYPLKLAAGIVPHMPMNYFWLEIFDQEIDEVGSNFGNMHKTHTKNSISALASLIWMIVQSVICYILAWYLSLVRPGYYGQARPWNFCFKTKKKMKLDPDEEKEHMTTDPRYFEPAPARTEVGIKIVNVSKVYNEHRALRNVSLEVYKGEITVLLGHNGAGKTTLMSIITGMASATEGKVYLNGKDTVTEHNEVRKNIGLCPQHNLFIDDLSVQQHIMFFTLLKRGTFAEARISSGKLAERLGLSDKLGSLPNQLSGGMKRRAQLACALAGGAIVLVLDEPTSGLDVETRRELWDLLLSLRGERTVLLSTHFMEEADALGDRVAALHSGVLRCFATTMHLKKAVGTGYRLSFTTIGLPNKAAITAVVKSHVPDATLKEQTKNSISYNLPAKQSEKFPKLFADLEAKKSELGLESIGVGVSTLEEVFLKLCSNIDSKSLHEDEVDSAGSAEPPSKKVTGILLYMRQLFVLLKRQAKYAIHKKWMFLTLNFLVPTILIFSMTNISNDRPPKDEDKSPDRLTMNLDMYDDRKHNRLLYHVDSPHVTEADVDKLRARYPKVTFEKADNLTDTIRRIGRTNVFQYNKYLVGIEVNQTDAKVLYTTVVRHAAPVALNLLSNMLAAHYNPRSDGNTITTINDPIIRKLNDDKPQEPKNLRALGLYGFLIIFISLSVSVTNISLPCKERLTGSRHIHIMSGCPAELHWLATLIFHMTTYVVGVVVPVVIAAIVLDKDNTINKANFLVAFVVVLLLGGLAFFAFSYLVSFYFGEGGTGIVLTCCCIVFGLLTPTMKGAIDLFKAPRDALYYFLLILDYTMPLHTMSMAGLKCLFVARINAYCKIVKKYCPFLMMMVKEDGFDADKCCAGKNPRCYFCIDKYGPGKFMIVLLVQFLVLMTMVILTERRFFNGLFDKLLNSRYKPEQLAEDEIVRAEKAYVRETIKLPAKNIPDSMLVDNLHKNYASIGSKAINAVKGVSFSVKKGECFGLLGVNGAGKSTCFKMITAEESATRGNLFSNGYHLRRGASQYLQTLGYCPQFFGLDMFQTGEENLAMILTLRGFDQHWVEEEVKNWIHTVGLEKYARTRVEDYSGGCVRRLGSAAALCGSAKLALLDEPTSGVDVAARRRLWAALRKGLRLQRAIVISSHSMDEMEALCSRIAILSGGHVRALGSAAGLRAAHASGYALVFKIAQREKDDEAAKTEINRLKAIIQERFNCTLKDEHVTMLHYHINETMQYSDLFSKLESLRKEFPSLIEDYSVTETTLEEVFLAFAKEQHELELRQQQQKEQQKQQKEQQKQQQRGPRAV